ncbi:MAG: hypothetical protein V3T30_02230 [Thermodesulfobacteriota bacterium]
MPAYKFKNSFVAVIDSLIKTLEGDDELKIFCDERFRSSLKVSKKYTDVEQINTGEYPIIMITRPDVDNSGFSASSVKVDIIHTVRLTCGFKRMDSRTRPERYLDDMIQWDELLDHVILTTPNPGGLQIKIARSMNDEGRFKPPYYFLVKEIKITQRINPLER